MARSVANVNQTTDNFAQWLDKTNTLLTAFSTEIVTANVATGWTTGNAQVNGFFSANTLIAGSALRGGNVTSNATLTITANLVANFTANVTGAAAFANSITVTGNAIFANTLSVTGNATFANTIAVTGNATFSNTTAHTGAASFSNTITVTGNVTFSNTFAVTGNVRFANTLAVTGATALANTLAVTGTTTVANLVASAVIIGSSPVTIATNSASTSSTTQTVVDSFPKSEGYFVKYLVGVRNASGSLVHSIELMAIHDGTTVSLSKYGEVFNTAILGTFDSIINNANAELKFTAANSTAYTIKTTRMHM